MGAHTYAQQSQAGSAPIVEKTAVQRLDGETIDNIIVPFDVLTAIQMYFEGYAVTHVTQIQRNGQSAYRLQVDRDDINNNADSFYLVFDTKWDFLGREAYVAPKPPAPVQVEKPQDDKKEETKPPTEKPEKPETENGGRGSGDTSGGSGEDSGGGSGGQNGDEAPTEQPPVTP